MTLSKVFCLFCALLLTGISATAQKKSPASLTGMWTSVSDKQFPPPPGYSDSVRFWGKDSFAIRIYKGSALERESLGVYRYDEKQQQLLLQSGTRLEPYFVRSFTADRLHLYGVSERGGQTEWLLMRVRPKARKR